MQRETLKDAITLVAGYTYDAAYPVRNLAINASGNLTFVKSTISNDLQGISGYMAGNVLSVDGMGNVVWSAPTSGGQSFFENMGITFTEYYGGSPYFDPHMTVTPDIIMFNPYPFSSPSPHGIALRIADSIISPGSEPNYPN